MTMDERIEKAVAVHAAYENRQEARTAIAQAMMAAAFPELFPSPPTHKIVPVEPTEEMCIAFDVGHEDAYESTEYPTRSGLRAALKVFP